MTNGENSIEVIHKLLDQAPCIEDVNGRRIKMLKLKDATLPDYLLIGDYPLKIRDIRHIGIREDDVIICTYPKTGSHWISSLIHYLIQKIPLDNAMPYSVKILDVMPPDFIESSPSPRVLVSHRRPHLLPVDVFRMKKKIVLACRNPKDTAVSFFLHVAKMAMKLSWNTFVECWMKVPLDDYCEFYNTWQTEIEQRKEFEVLVVQYDEMQKNSLEELRRIQDFLGISHSDEHLLKIIEKCSIDNLRNKVETGQVSSYFVKEGKSVIFRKGTIGDWKNHFTVAQSEKMDAVMQKKLRKDTMVLL